MTCTWTGTILSANKFNSYRFDLINEIYDVRIIEKDSLPEFGLLSLSVPGMKHSDSKTLSET